MNDDNKQLNTEELTEETQVDVTPSQETNDESLETSEQSVAEQIDAEMEDSDTPTPSETDLEAEADVQDEVDQENEQTAEDLGVSSEETTDKSPESEGTDEDENDNTDSAEDVTTANDNPNAKWYVVHTYSGHENRVATNLRQRIESEHLEHKIIDILVPTQDKIEIRGGKKEQVKEKVFPGYILVKMDLDNIAWIAVRTTQGVIGFVGAGTKPVPISEAEVKSIVQFMSQGAAPTFKEVFMVDDTVKIIDGPFADFIGKVESVDKEKGKLRVLVSIFGRETPVELDFLQVSKL